MTGYRVHSTPPPDTSKISHDDAIERALFALIASHADEPGLLIVSLADRVVSHQILARLRLVPARDRLLSFSDSCRTITSSLKGDA